MATEQPQNPPAFPQGEFSYDAWDGREGMTLRDWFAGQVSPQVVAAAESANGTNEELAIGVANLSYLIADAMLNARRAAIARATGEA